MPCISGIVLFTSNFSRYRYYSHFMFELTELVKQIWDLNTGL